MAKQECITGAPHTDLLLGVAAGMAIGGISVWLLRRDRTNGASGNGVLLKHSVIVKRRPEDCYRAWRDLYNLPRFLPQVKSIRVLDDKQSRWEAGGFGPSPIRWCAIILNDIENEMIGWRSTPGSGVEMAGSLRFESVRVARSQATEVQVTMRFHHPGRLRDKLAGWLRNAPQQHLESVLANFKEVMEREPADAVEEASMDSFPASDPPAWTSAHA